jgi:hypothetical protein
VIWGWIVIMCLSMLRVLRVLRVMRLLRVPDNWTLNSLCVRNNKIHTQNGDELPLKCFYVDVVLFEIEHFEDQMTQYELHSLMDDDFLV